MLILILACLAMAAAGFAMSSIGQDMLKSLVLQVSLDNPRNARPITRSHATAAAGLGKARSFGKR